MGKKGRAMLFYLGKKQRASLFTHPQKGRATLRCLLGGGGAML